MQRNGNKEQKFKAKRGEKTHFFRVFFPAGQRCSNHLGVVHMIFKTGLMVFANACVYALVRVYLTYSLTHTSTDQLLEQASMAKTKQNQNLSAQFSPADKTDRVHTQCKNSIECQVCNSLNLLKNNLYASDRP